MNTFYVGTEDGLFKLRVGENRCDAEPETALRGKKVLCGKTVGGRIVATCYRDGVYLSDDSGASWKTFDDKRLKRVRCLTQATWNGEEVLFIGTEPVGLF